LNQNSLYGVECKKCDYETDSFAKGATFEQLIYRIKMNKQTDDASNAQVMG
jgi:hypothetical protein